MATKHLYYIGDAKGQSASIERAGYVFTRGCSTEVPSDVFDALKDEPGFAPGKTAPRNKRSEETENDG